MRLIKTKTEATHQEITLEYKFLWKKYTVTYRKIEDCIFEYTSKNYYEPLGACQYVNINPYFLIKDIEA